MLGNKECVCLSPNTHLRQVLRRGLWESQSFIPHVLSSVRPRRTWIHLGSPLLLVVAEVYVGVNREQVCCVSSFESICLWLSRIKASTIAIRSVTVRKLVMWVWQIAGGHALTFQQVLGWMNSEINIRLSSLWWFGAIQKGLCSFVRLQSLAALVSSLTEL